ncbi:MAG: gliding motility-associated C-terminal domain-containing protein [Saprospiraceae bacterium]|nr:gliding motility-associated C-terminal domain-containing protein [Saprospiraceae bacterium]
MKKHSYNPLMVPFLVTVVLGITAIGQPSALQAQPAAGLPLAQSIHKSQGAKLLFMENQGQVTGPAGEARPEVLFMANGKGCKIFISATELSYQFEKTEYPERYAGVDPGMLANHRRSLEKQPKTTTHRFSMRLLNANPHPRVFGETKTSYVENYYNIPSKPEGIPGVPSFEKVILKDIYPGIDWVIYFKEQGLKYDFVVHPGADPALIQLEYADAEGLKLNEDGSLTISTSLGTVTEAAPVCYQIHKPLNSRFVVTQNRVFIELEDYDPKELLVIDPDVIWATYYGGGANDSGHFIETDAAGNVYLAGSTNSNNAIAAAGHQNVISSQSDAFLVKMNAEGVRLWATYYGGGGFDAGHGLAVDASGNIYLGGSTSSQANMAIGGHQNVYAGSDDALLVKFDANGIRQWATYYGGPDDEEGLSVATDALGNVYLAGNTRSLSGIAAAGHQNIQGGNIDLFIVKFNASGFRQWATYYGGELDDAGFCKVVVAPDGSLYLSGYTRSVGGIAFGGHQNTLGGNLDAFLVKFNAAGTRLWGTYYGGANGDLGWSVACDALGNVYLAGQTRSTTGIAFGGHQNTYSGAEDAFLVKFSEAGNRLWATYYGGLLEDLGVDVAVDAGGYAYLVGRTNSVTGIAFDGYQNTHAGGYYDTFLTRFSPEGIRHWGTYYGGDGADHTIAAQVDVFGNVYVGGRTTSANGLALDGHQNVYGGDQDAFLVKFCASLSFTAVLTDAPCPGDLTGEIAFTNLYGATNYEFSINNGATWATTGTFSDLIAGEYHLLVRNASLTACTSPVLSGTIQVGLDAIPPVALCQNVSLQLAADGTVTIAANQVDNGSFDNCGDFNLTLSQTNFTCANVGANALTLTATDLSGNSHTCTAILTILDPLDPAILAAPVVLAIPQALCPDERGMATAFSPGASAYNWSDGSSGPEVALPGPGTYQISVTKGCGVVLDTAFVIEVLALPEIEIPEAATILCPGNSTQISAITDANSEITWSTGQSGAEIRVDLPGLYIATATNECGSTSDSIALLARGCDNCFYIPNAFSPNGDGVNDQFIVASICPVEAYRLQVFSRWGELLFDNRQPGEGWNGIGHNKPLPPGVYVWLLVYTQEGESFKKTGEVNLLR